MAAEPPTYDRRIPGETRTCDRCGASILMSTTVASIRGRGGKAFPIDPHEHPAGNTAIRPEHRGRLLARVLGRDDTVDHPIEYLAMPHFATCAPSLPRSTS